MPPRFAYWTIIVDGGPTSFRAREREELEPTLRQLRTKSPDAVMRWFSGGKLWDSPEDAKATRSSERREESDQSWRSAIDEIRQKRLAREASGEGQVPVEAHPLEAAAATTEADEAEGGPEATPVAPQFALPVDVQQPEAEARPISEDRADADREPRRGKDWRPGGEHKDPRDKYKGQPGSRRASWKKRNLGFRPHGERHGDGSSRGGFRDNRDGDGFAPRDDRGDFRPREDRDSRGDFRPRNDRDGFVPKGDRGGFAPREDRGGFRDNRGGGGFAPKGDRYGSRPPSGSFRPGGDRGDFRPRNDRDGFVPKGDRGGFAPREDRGGFRDNRGGGGFAPKGDRYGSRPPSGSFRPGGDRGDFRPRNDRDGFAPKGDRGGSGFAPRAGNAGPRGDRPAYGGQRDRGGSSFAGGRGSRPGEGGGFKPGGRSGGFGSRPRGPKR